MERYSAFEWEEQAREYLLKARRKWFDVWHWRIHIGLANHFAKCAAIARGDPFMEIPDYWFKSDTQGNVHPSMIWPCISRRNQEAKARDPFMARLSKREHMAP